ncbi:MAG TPA: biopolymer transporter ExbD [Croceibacterium sp.]|nr:biopolymer transporter ExbD [Croceibacterium sp.]
MALASLSSPREPLGAINTTPLIDVMLILLVMVILSIPVATHTLHYDLPAHIAGRPDPVRNSLGVDVDGSIRWNGAAVSEAELGGMLVQVRTMRPEPEVQFRPDANAAYERTAQVLRIVKASRITRFGFADNEKYRTFTR